MRREINPTPPTQILLFLETETKQNRHEHMQRETLYVTTGLVLQRPVHQDQPRHDDVWSRSRGGARPARPRGRRASSREVVDVLRRSLFVHVHVCYIVKHFDSCLRRNIFSAAFNHVPAKLGLETHSWVQIGSMIAQEPI